MWEETLFVHCNDRPHKLNCVWEFRADDLDSQTFISIRTESFNTTAGRQTLRCLSSDTFFSEPQTYFHWITKLKSKKSGSVSHSLTRTKRNLLTSCTLITNNFRVFSDSISVNALNFFFTHFLKHQLQTMTVCTTFLDHPSCKCLRLFYTWINSEWKQSLLLRYSLQLFDSVFYDLCYWFMAAQIKNLKSISDSSWICTTSIVNLILL